MPIRPEALPRVAFARKCVNLLLRVVVLSCLLLTVGSFGFAQPAAAADLSRPVPKRARRLVQEGRRLAKQDKFVAAEAKFRQAIKIAPQFVQAHLNLVYLKTYFVQETGSTEVEYRELARLEPLNPVYPLVLAVSRLERTHDYSPPEEKTELLQRASKLVPDWPWAHYARAFLHKRDGKYEEMVRELEQFLRDRPQVRLGWVHLAWTLDGELGRWTEAEKAYRQMAKLRGHPVSLNVWRMRLKASGESDAARARLRKELGGWQKRNLLPQYRMVVARAYRALLNDDATAQGIEDAVKRSHPNWTRPVGYDSGAPYTVREEIDGPLRVLAGGRHGWLFIELRRAEQEKDFSKRIDRIRWLMARKPIPALRWLMQRSLFEAQIGAKSWSDAKATLDELLASKPRGVGSRLKLALALADSKVDLEDALRLVQEAGESQLRFQEWTRPKEFGLEEWKRHFGSPEYQRRVHNNTLAAIADAKGWVLAQQEKLEEAERELRTAVGLNPNPQAQYHLGLVLDQRGEIPEALDVLVRAASQQSPFQAKARKAADLVFEKEHAAGVDALIKRVKEGQMEGRREQILNEFIQEPAKDFELTALNGRSYRLSALRGKVVLINFWSIYCGPCIAEMPDLVRLYQEYQEAGLEILSIAIDDYEVEVKAFVEERRLPFPVLFDTDNKVGSLYEVNGVPDNLFIDRAGNIRLRHLGRRGEAALRVVVKALLEGPPPSNSVPKP